MRKNSKIIRTTLITIATIILAAITSFAAGTFSENWYQSGDSWRIRDRNGSDIVNAWVCDDAVPENGKNVWYLLDGNGNMVSAGLVQDGTGNFYSIETNHNGYYGMLRYQPGTYDGISLDLDQSHDGAFGAVTNQAGIDALKAKYGVTKIGIDNGNIVYTSDEKNAKTVANTAVTAAASATTTSDHGSYKVLTATGASGSSWTYVFYEDGTSEEYDPKKHDPDNYYKKGGAIPDYVQRVLKEDGEVDWVKVQELYSIQSKELTCQEYEDMVHEGIDIYRYYLGYGPLTRDRELEAKIRAFSNPDDVDNLEKIADEFREYENIKGANGLIGRVDMPYQEIAAHVLDMRNMVSDRLALVILPYKSKVDPNSYNACDKLIFQYWT